MERDKVINVIFIGQICDQELFETKNRKGHPYFVAQYSFERALLEQFKKQGFYDVLPLGINLVNYFPKDDILFIRSRSEIVYLMFLNFPIIKEITLLIGTFWNLIHWAFSSRNKKRFIFLNIHYTPVSLAIVIASRILGLKTAVVFTDLDVFTFSKEKIKRMNLLKKLIIQPYVALNKYLQHRFDFYIIFSRQMNSLVNPYNKPNIVIEGIHSLERIITKVSFRKEKAIAHAGTLNAEYGIRMILDVFERLNDLEYELWLFGMGDMVDEIKKRSLENNRINYFGFIPRDVLFSKLAKAELLINLRDPDLEFTKFSFPSKLFEYMTSGTPVFTTKLEGIPNEYNQYLYTCDGYDIEEIEFSLREVLQKSEKELKMKASKASKFINENKTAEKQFNRIMHFIDENISHK